MAFDLDYLAREEGYVTGEELLHTVALSSVQPGLCTHCGYVASSVEPDQAEGWCEECEAGTVQSVSVLGGWA